MRPKRKVAQELRQAIDCLPARTREAMLDGIDANSIIVGAYSDGSGGVCPMLAAHRRGGRTSLASFARAWDRYTEARSARRATQREIRTLRAMLEASLWYEVDDGDLARAVAEHSQRKAERDPVETAETERRDTGERDRTSELRNRPGWAWLRVFRRLDDWELALAQVERQEAERDRGNGADEHSDERELAGV
jgi:hypothetical protein